MDPVSTAAIGWGISAVGWIASPIINKLLTKCFSYLGFDKSKKLDDLTDKILELELLQEAVEESPHRGRMENLLEKLRHAFYEAEDILDEVEYYRLERQILSQPDGRPPRRRNWAKKMIQSAVPKSFHLKKQVNGNTSDDPPPGMSKKQLKKCLEEIEKIVIDAHRLMQILNLPRQSNVDKRQTVAANSRSAATTAAPPPVVFGREEDRENIIAMLHDTGGDGQAKANSALSYSIIGIHGISGSGKSTLAQFVCASEKKDKQGKKEGHFELIMWVHVSQNCNVDTIFSAVLEEATGIPCLQFSSLNTLQKTLEEALSGKRFLLVLDDIWYNEGVSQDDLQKVVSPLMFGHSASKILVTERDRLTSRKPTSWCSQIDIHRPCKINEQHCLLFMRSHGGPKTQPMLAHQCSRTHARNRTLSRSQHAYGGKN